MLTQEELTILFTNFINANSFKQQPLELYEPFNYIMGIGGKRLRPVLLLMSYQLFGDKVEEALPAAFAIEVFHNFSLLHDDIMDEAPLRRGQPSVHIKYGINAGILSGDVMLIYAYESLLQYDDPHLAKALLATFNKVAIEVCEGQQYDMNFETQGEVALGAYLKMIELKTAALLGGAMKMGALIGGASEMDALHLEAFGRNIGIAFQLQDDILDTFGDPEKFGKKVGGDIAQNKKTFLVLKTLEMADVTLSNKLKGLMNDTDMNEENKIEQVKSIFLQVGIEKMAEQKKEEYLDIALNHLTKVKAHTGQKAVLEGLAVNLMQRMV